MVFSSLYFLYLFLPLTVLLYFVTPKKFRCFTLLLCSLVFFAWGELKYLLLMLFTVTVDYLAGLLLGLLRKKGCGKKREKPVLIAAVIVNLGLLGLFKYADFFLGTVNGIFKTDVPLLELALPLGISFYTFQALSYVIDVYKEQCSVQKSFVKFAMYITMFPQLIAGPIVRYTDVEAQMDDRSVTPEQVARGIRRFLVGLGKKVLFANTAGALFDSLHAYGDSLSSLGAVLMALCYTFQIYFDFSGYSDMAIGLGRIFGFDFPENFRYPYEADSITDFWRRWHITLSTFFREYVYIPLGGNRCGKARQIFNLFVVWLLTGFWHGAGWTFLLWGLYFFVLLMLEKTFLLRLLQKAPKFVGHLYALVFIVFGWVIFSAESVGDVGGFLVCLFGKNGFCDDVSLYYLVHNVLPLLLFAVGSTRLPLFLAEKANAKLGEKAAFPLRTVGCACLLLLCTAFLAGDGYNPFLYFRF